MNTNENLTNLEAIAYLSTQQEGMWDIVPHKEKRSLSQNAFYHMIKGIIAKSMKVPPCYVHNLLLRRCEVYEMVDEKPVCISLPDTDEAEHWAEYHELYHYKPTLSTFQNSNGVTWRWYKVLKGSKEFSVEEMTRLIDIALDEMEHLGLMLPRDKATMEAYEQHKKKSTQTHEV